MFDQDELIQRSANKKDSTVELSLDEYQECFEFAIKMAYSSNSRHETGIRDQKSEVQMGQTTLSWAYLRKRVLQSL